MVSPRVLRNAQSTAARNTWVPGIGSIDADNQRVGATDHLARLIRPLWTGDNGPRALPGHISERPARRRTACGFSSWGTSAVSWCTSGSCAVSLVKPSRIAGTALQVLREVGRASATRGGAHEIGDGNTPRRLDGALDGSKEVPCQALHRDIFRQQPVQDHGLLRRDAYTLAENRDEVA
jgi:hypothetical protein